MSRIDHEIPPGYALPDSLASAIRPRWGGYRDLWDEDDESDFTPRQPDMTPEQWRVYHEGEKPTREDIQRFLRGSYSPSARMGFTPSELGVEPGDWDDPRYRMIYTHVPILREESVAEDERSRVPPEFELSEEESDDSEAEIVFIGPGRRNVEALITFLARFSGADMEVKMPYDRDLGYATVRITKRMRRLIEKKGFLIGDMELELDYGYASD